jgi:UDP-N-acetylglucosamine transferase subunit ALG13
MRILIAPLDWGLGHATRCIPVIRYLLEKGCEVVIGADGRPMQLLKKEFPALEFVVMSGYNISYPKRGSMALKIAFQIPKIVSGINREHKLLKEIIKEKNIDAVISDNRFGLWSREVPCVFITHQLMVKSPFGEKWIHHLNKKYILKYTECWVPDLGPSAKSSPQGGGLEGRLSGDLANKFALPANAKYIGLLSRFFAKAQNDKTKNKLLVILSGPEPQRTVLEEKIIKQLENIPLSPPLKGELTAVIVQGITEKNERRKIAENIEMVSHLTSEELQKEILSSEIILSRSGYSTVMDLAMMEKKAIFIPTSGQTEQEYLSKYFMDKKMVYSVSQEEFKLDIALKESKKYTGFIEKYSREEFKSAVDLFLAKAQSTQ